MFYMNINIPKNVKFIIDTYYNNNYEAFMVGGCVRDSLLGLKPKDFDITTSALPEITENLFTKTIPTGIKHWHGAAPDSWFSHLAVEVPGTNTSNEWLEPVSDEDYSKLK